MKGQSAIRFISFLILALGWILALVLWLKIVTPGPIRLPSHPMQSGIIEPPPLAGMPTLASAFAQEKQSLPAAALAFVLLDENGDTLFASPLANTAMCPASALKTLTTAAAMEIFGPDFRFETRLAATAAIGADGTLDGDLILIGGGDPTLSLANLEEIARAAHAAGLRKITGQIRVAADIFPHHPMSDHWNWGDIGNAYGAGAFGLNVNHNRMIIRFGPAAEAGLPAEIIGSEPALPGVIWQNHVTTGPTGSGDGVMVYSEPYSNRISTRGTVPLGESGFGVRAAIPDPPALALATLRQQLTKAGIEFPAAVAGENSTAASVTIHIHRSAPLAEIIDHLHRVSDNLEAQCLFLMLGHHEKADPTRVIQDHFEKSGVAFEGLRLIDGSGLARANMIRPIDLARANLAARKSPIGERFFQSLTASPSGYRSKNGAMSGVRTEVGFIQMPDDKEATFALMANGLTGSVDFRALRERLLTAATARE